MFIAYKTDIEHNDYIFEIISTSINKHIKACTSSIPRLNDF